MPKKIRNGFVKKRKDVEKDLRKKIGLFDKLGDFCLTCEAPFDKTDIKEVSTWRVVVKGDEVRTYCPDCFEAATKVVKDFKERIEERMNVSGSTDV